MMIFILFGCSLGLAPFNSEELSLEDIYPNTNASDNASFEFVDNDEDGYSVEDGDCNDDDPDIFPSQIDSCDNIDNDCDNIVDEDAVMEAWENNDDEPLYVGDYFADNEVYYEASIGQSSDVDRYQLYIADPIGGYFQINVTLDSLSGNTDYVVELHLVEDANGQSMGLLQSADNSESGGLESISQNGRPFIDDGGLYEIVIYANDESGCDTSYALTVQFSV